MAKLWTNLQFTLRKPANTPACTVTFYCREWHCTVLLIWPFFRFSCLPFLSFSKQVHRSHQQSQCCIHHSDTHMIVLITLTFQCILNILLVFLPSCHTFIEFVYFKYYNHTHSFLLWTVTVLNHCTLSCIFQYLTWILCWNMSKDLMARNEYAYNNNQHLQFNNWFFLFYCIIIYLFFTELDFFLTVSEVSGL